VFKRTKAGSSIIGVISRKWISATIAGLLLFHVGFTPLGTLGATHAYAAAFEGFDEGDGSKVNPYKISKPEQLYYVSVTQSVYLNSYFKLSDEIDTLDLSDYSAGGAWIPIGTKDHPFRGGFDGGDKPITGLEVQRDTPNGGFGLFGVAEGASFANVVLQDVDVKGDFQVGALVGYLKNGKIANSHVSGRLRGKNEVGCLVGYMFTGTISNSTANCNIKASTNAGGLVGSASMVDIVNGKAQGTLEPLDDRSMNFGGLAGTFYYGEIADSESSVHLSSSFGTAGGLVGSSTLGTIDNSHASGSLSGNGSNVGGLIGFHNGGKIKNSSASGDVEGFYRIGGLVAVIKNYDSGPDEIAEIDSSHATGKVTANGGVIANHRPDGVVDVYVSDVGGLVGANYEAAIRNSFASGDVVGEENNVGGLVGYNEYGNMESNYASGAVTGNNSKIGGLVGYNYANNGNGNIQSSHATGEVSGTGNGQREVGGLIGLNNWGVIADSFASGAVKADYGVGGLVGFNDRGIVRNSYATGGVTGISEVGGLVGAHGTLRIESSYATGDVTGHKFIGGLVGSNSGEVKECFASGNVSGKEDVGGLVGMHTGWNPISLSYSTGDVSGRSRIGGLAGTNAGVINNSFASGNSKAEADQGGFPIAGGLVGFNDRNGEISQSYASGSVKSVGYAGGGLVGMNGGNIQDSYARGMVTGGTLTGGLTGMHDGKMERAYASNTVEGSDAVGALIGKMSGDHTKVAFAYWDKDVTGQLPDFAWDLSTDAILEDRAGHSTQAMMKRDTYANWSDFDRIWFIKEDESYPLLVEMPLALTSLNLKANGTSYTLSPAFNPSQSAYTVHVPSSVTSVDVVSEHVDGANVKVAGATGLKVGINTIKVTLNRFGSSDSKEYVITVTRDAGSDPDIGGGTNPGSGTNPGGGTGSVSAGGQPSTFGPYQFKHENELEITVPAGAATQELKVTLTKLTDTANLVGDRQALSSLFEVKSTTNLKLSKKAKVVIRFDPKKLGNNQKPALFVYDEEKKIWVEIGGAVEGDALTAEVDQLAKLAMFAVFAVGGEPKDNTPEKATATWSDIRGHWAEGQIKEAGRIGMVSGYSDHTFRPDQPISRAEFAVMLVQALKLKGDEKSPGFTDSDRISPWARQAIALAAQAGLIKGYGDGTFRPETQITRAEIATITLRSLNLQVGTADKTSFADDATIPEWTKALLTAASKKGIIIVSGRSGNQFAPNENATRAEAVVMIMRMLRNR